MSIKVTSSILFGACDCIFLYFRNSCQPCGSEKKMAWSKFRPPFISLRDAESAFCLISPPCLLAGFDRVCQCLSLGSHCVCVSIPLYLCVYVSVYPGVSVCPCIYLCVSMCPLCALPYCPTVLPCWVGSHALVSCILVRVFVSAPPLCIYVCLCVFLSVWPLPCWPFMT